MRSRSITGMTRRGRNIWVAMLAMLVLAVGAVLIYREPMEPLSMGSLDEARRQWEAAGIADYTWRYEMAGGEIVVRVRGGEVVELTRDGLKATSNRPEEFAVVGVFDILERELEILNDPNNPFGGDPRTTMLRVRFHPELGYVERYLRAVGGSGRSTSLESFELHEE